MTLHAQSSVMILVSYVAKDLKTGSPRCFYGTSLLGEWLSDLRTGGEIFLLCKLAALLVLRFFCMSRQPGFIMQTMSHCGKLRREVKPTLADFGGQPFRFETICPMGEVGTVICVRY